MATLRRVVAGLMGTRPLCAGGVTASTGRGGGRGGEQDHDLYCPTRHARASCLSQSGPPVTRWVDACSISSHGNDACWLACAGEAGHAGALGAEAKGAWTETRRDKRREEKTNQSERHAHI